MWLSDRRYFLLSLTALAGCGFAPVYGTGPGGQASTLRGRIDFATPADEEGFALVKRLEDRLGQSRAADLSLLADIRISEEAVGFLPDGEISRFNVIGQVDWRLARIGDGTGVASGSERSFTSYSATSTTVATTFAQRDARRRLMVILADRIVTDLLARDFS
ncbi:MAG: LPS assembly lipoprotein LptE [Silicimonas sp.]|jgi:LPS-assembly lipoprotein|nr:LPS assembly lipoprotein LptE [Silicimonas sp.]